LTSLGDDREVRLVADLLVSRVPKSWLQLIELVNVTEIVALARAFLARPDTGLHGDDEGCS
jgi:hypothetical protein